MSIPTQPANIIRMYARPSVTTAFSMPNSPNTAAESDRPMQACGHGRGGRNAEFLLSLLHELKGHRGIYAIACDTDGIDGPIDAAGAICDGRSRLTARAINVSAREHLAQNDSYDFFDKLGDLIITGPTGTNVMDIGIVLID